MAPNILTRLRKAALRRSSYFLARRPAAIYCNPPIISFSFDDVLASAARTGSAILEKHGVQGTFYIALKLAGRVGENGPRFTIEDAERLHRSGHELGCHTYSHLECSKTTCEEYAADIAENAAVASRHLPGVTFRNFAYPSGDVTAAHKRALAGQFDSLRGIRSGINHGRIDLNHLRAIPLYERIMDEEKVARLLHEARIVNGWVIFYTHDVEENPSDWGCTANLLDKTIEMALQSGCRILPVGPALNVLHKS